jgi:hypothetical protein
VRRIDETVMTRKEQPETFQRGNQRGTLVYIICCSAGFCLFEFRAHIRDYGLGMTPEVVGWVGALVIWNIMGLIMCLGGIVVTGISAFLNPHGISRDYWLFSASGVISGAVGMFLWSTLDEQIPSNQDHVLAFLMVNVCVSALALGACVLHRFLKNNIIR